MYSNYSKGREVSWVARALSVGMAVCAIVAVCLTCLAESESPPASDKPKEPVKIEAMDMMSFDAVSDIIVLSGKVKVAYMGDNIKADKLTIRGKSDIEAEGNVVLARDNQELTGAALVYSLKTREGRLSDVKAKVTGEGVKGFVFLRSEQLTGSSEHYSLNSGSLTTCNLEYPHYHVEAKSIEVWPGDRIVVRGLSYHEGRLRILYLPYFVFPLKKENTLALPQVGYGQREGIYVKLSYNYYLSEKSNGLLHLDLYQKLGIGGGVDHNFKVNALKSDGTASIYALGNKSTGHTDVFADLKYRQPLFRDWNSEFRFQQASTMAVPQGVERLERSGLASLTKKSDVYTGEFQANYRQVDELAREQTIAAKTRQLYKLNETLTASIDADYAEKSASDALMKSVLTYKAEIKDVKPGRTISLVAQEALNPDRLQTEVTPSWMSVAKLPEISVQYTDLLSSRREGKPEWAKLPKVMFNASAGSYRERVPNPGVPNGETSVEGQRLDAQVGFKGHTIELSKSTSLELTALGRASAYATGDERLAFVTGAAVKQALTPELNARLAYQYEDFWGLTPFRFDVVPKSQYLSGSLDYKGPKASASVGTSYNIESPAAPWGDITASASVNPTEKVSVSGDVRYSASLSEFKTASAKVKYSPTSLVTVDGSAKYDFTKGNFDSFSGKAEVKIPLDVEKGYDLKLGYDGLWDNTTQQFTRNDISLGYHMHCRELRLSYRQSTGQVWLEYRIDAFPGTDVKVGAGQGTGLMLDVEGLDLLE